MLPGLVPAYFSGDNIISYNIEMYIIVEGYIVRLSRGKKYLRGYLFCLYSIAVRHTFSL